jgi:Domain of unknown function (DUF6431)
VSVVAKSELFFFSQYFSMEESVKPLYGRHPARSAAQVRASTPAVILFVAPSAAQGKPVDWGVVGTDSIPRQCPECLGDSVVGHGRRRKQAHDENHDWIGIRRGFCNQCQKTITFLPSFSLPYTHYSLITRSQALQRYFVEGCSLDLAAPLVKDPNRIPVASTLRRWFRSLDSADRWDRLPQLQPIPSSPPPSPSTLSIRSAPAFPFLQRMLEALHNWLAPNEILRYGQFVLSWQTCAHFLQVLLPLRL